MERSVLLPFVLALVPMLSACQHAPAAVTPRRGAGPTVPTEAYFEAGGSVPEARSREVLWRKDHSEMVRIELPPRVPVDLADVARAQDPIEIQWMRPRPAGAEPRPLVLMFPILNNKMTLMNELASGFVRQGYSVAVLPRKEIAFDPIRSIDGAEQESRLLIMRGRQALDWLVRQPLVDADRVALFGVSAGGIVGASMMGADARIKAGVLVFAGGPMADVMVASTEDRVTEKMALVERRRGWSRARIRDELRASLRTDPVVLAPRVKRDNVLLFIARKDRSVPTSTQRALYEALGRPEAFALDTGHYTGFALFFPFIAHKSRRFIARRLEGAPHPAAAQAE